MSVSWDVYLCYSYGWEAISSVKELPSLNPICRGHIRFLSFTRILGHYWGQKNGGYHLFRIQINCIGWLFGCPNPRCFFDVGTKRFVGTQRREYEASQRVSNRWQTQAPEAQTKACYWQNEHSIVSEELSKCRKSWGLWKRKVEAKKI